MPDEGAAAGSGAAAAAVSPEGVRQMSQRNKSLAAEVTATTSAEDTAAKAGRGGQQGRLWSATT